MEFSDNRDLLLPGSGEDPSADERGFEGVFRHRKILPSDVRRVGLNSPPNFRPGDVDPRPPEQRGRPTTEDGGRRPEDGAQGGGVGRGEGQVSFGCFDESNFRADLLLEYVYVGLSCLDWFIAHYYIQ